MTHPIITGFRDSPGGRDALALGIVLHELDPEAEHVVTQIYLYNPPAENGPPKGWREALRDRADAELAAARAVVGDRPRTSVRTCCGVSPADGLHRLAAELGARTVVVGVSHHRGLERITTGSVTEQTLHGSPCPVAIAPVGYAGRQAPRIRKVAVAYNGSEESRRALDDAARLARAAGATLTILGALETAAVWYGAYAGSEDVRVMRAATRDELDLAASRVRGTVEDVGVEVLEGPPAPAVADAAAPYDLLVLGSRGHGPLGGTLLGSVSARLVRRARCPTIVVPRTAATRTMSADGVPLDAAV